MIGDFFGEGDAATPPDPRANPNESLAREAVQLVVAAITPGMNVMALYRALGEANGMAYEEVEAALKTALTQKLARAEGAGTDRKLWRST